MKIKKLWPALVLFLPTIAQAATVDALLQENDKTIGKNSDLYGVFDSLVNRLPAILGGMAFLALLYSGFMYVMALGDPSKMESAKKNITWVFTGIIAVAVIYVVINYAVKFAQPGQLTGNPLL